MRKAIVRPRLDSLTVVLTGAHHMDSQSVHLRGLTGKRGKLTDVTIRPEMQAPQGSYVMAGQFEYLDGMNNKKSIFVHYASFTPVSVMQQLRISYAIIATKVREAVGRGASCH